MATVPRSREAALEVASKRKPTNVSLPVDLLTAARELGVNVSRASPDGVAAAVKAERERRWLEENREAIRSQNEWIEKNGLPLAKYRLF